MPAIFVYHHRVRPEEIDGVGHANNVCYLRWMQDAAVAHSAAQGWPAERYRAAGIGWVARSHFIEYLQPAFVEDPILIRTWVSSMQRVSSTRQFEIVRQSDERLLARAETHWAFVRFSDHRLMRIPPDVMSAFELVPTPSLQHPSRPKQDRICAPANG